MGAIALAALAQLTLLIFHSSVLSVATALLLFFIAFNLLEAMLPSLVSKTAPLAAKGTAMGVYSSVQFLGAFVGATAGGFLMEYFGGKAVLIFAIVQDYQDKITPYHHQLIGLIFMHKHIIDRVGRDLHQHRLVTSLRSIKLNHPSFN